MHATLPKPRFPIGSRLRVTHFVRVGHRRWTTQIVGTLEAESIRPVGGIEMGSRALAETQPTLRLRHDDGEITVVSLDELTQVEVLAQPAAAGPDHPVRGDAPR